MQTLLDDLRFALRQLRKSRDLALATALILTLFVASADASLPCPLTLVSGAGNGDAIIVTFRNAGKLPIRRLEFNCTLVHAQADKAQGAVYREANALFFPGATYTVRYAYPGGVPRPVLVSVRSITLSDGYVWNPSRRQTCRVLRIAPGSAKK